MAKEYFRCRYKDYSDSYVANMNSYHLGTSFMGECVDHFFMVEPINGPAFYEYIKNMEKKRILPGIDWERFGDELKRERVLFYKELHENKGDASIYFAVSKGFFLSEMYKRWRLYEYQPELFEDGDFGEKIACRAEFSLYLSGKAELIDRLIRHTGISYADIPLDDASVFEALSDGNARSFDELVFVTDVHPDNNKIRNGSLINPAQSMYEAWTATILEWFHIYYKDLYDDCFRQSVTDRKTGELTDYYYWSDEFGRT